MSISDILNALDAAGMLGAFVIMLLLLLRGELVTKREYNRLLDEKNEWRDVAKPALTAASRALEVAAQGRRRQGDG